MNDQQWDPNICNDRSGFLFNHACDQFPTVQCVRCVRPICNDHAKPSAEGTICTTCAKSERKEAGKFQKTGRRYRRHDDYDDDPYFYGQSHYPHYGNYGRGRWGFGYYHWVHNSDFTEADAESMMQPDVVDFDNDFEADMGES